VRFYPLEKLINLHDNYMRHFRIDHRDLLLIQRRGDVFLIEGGCPHRGHPLDTATIDRGILQCALHQYQFELHSGRLLHATEERCRDLRTYQLVFEGNEVGVILGEREDVCA
jgi:nitrite reductase/ring-hydroxylating ferredoxin subunit